MSAIRYTVHTTPVGTHFVFDTLGGKNVEFPKSYENLADAERRAAEMNELCNWWRS